MANWQHVRQLQPETEPRVCLNPRIKTNNLVFLIFIITLFFNTYSSRHKLNFRTSKATQPFDFFLPPHHEGAPGIKDLSYSSSPVIEDKSKLDVVAKKRVKFIRGF